MPFSASMPNLSRSIPTAATPSSGPVQRLHRELSFSESDIGCIEDGMPLLKHAEAMALSGNAMVELLQQATRILDTDYAESMATMSAAECDLVLTMQTFVEQGAQAALLQAGPGTPAQTLALQAQAYLDAAVDAPLTDHERSISVLDFLGKVVNNQFSDAHFRWAANFANAGLRTGLIVALTTVVRQLIGFEVEKALQLGDVTLSSRELIGFSAMLLGSGLNLAGALRDEMNHTATVQSRLSRASMAALSVGALVLASQIGDPSVLGAAMSSIGVQTASYTLGRDLMQLFFPLYDNAGINLGGTLAGAASYSVAQFLTGEAMDRFAPSSGAGRVMSAARALSDTRQLVMTRMAQWFAEESDVAARTAGIPDKVHRALRVLQPDLTQDMTRGALNAMAEVSDDLVRAGASRLLLVRQIKALAQAEAVAEGRDPAASVAALPSELTEGLRIRLGARVPNAQQVADQFFNVSAMRTSAFEFIMGMAMSASVAMEKTNLSESNQAHAVNAVVAGAAALIYSSFVHVNVRPASLAQKRSECDMGPQDLGRQGKLPETVLRRRHRSAPAP